MRAPVTAVVIVIVFGFGAEEARESRRRHIDQFPPDVERNDGSRATTAARSPVSAASDWCSEASVYHFSPSHAVARTVRCSAGGISRSSPATVPRRKHMVPIVVVHRLAAHGSETSDRDALCHDWRQRQARARAGTQGLRAQVSFSPHLARDPTAPASDDGDELRVRRDPFPLLAQAADLIVDETVERYCATVQR